MNHPDPLSRRELIKTAAGAGMAATLAPFSGFLGRARRQFDAIAAENVKPGHSVTLAPTPVFS
jgi:hypothetical protein